MTVLGSVLPGTPSWEWQRAVGCSEAGCCPAPAPPPQLPHPSCDDLVPACLRGRKEVRRAASSFPFSALLQAPGSFPFSASEEGTAAPWIPACPPSARPAAASMSASPPPLWPSTMWPSSSETMQRSWKDSVACRGISQIMSVLLFIEHSIEVAHGKASCKLSKMGYLRIADLISSFMLIAMLFVISLSLLIGVVKNREKYLLPFLSLQIMDYLLCLLTLLGSYIELPAYLKLASRSRASPSKFPLMTLQLLDFCLSILTLCSSYMEVPTYLNFKSMNHMNYLPSQEDMPYNQFIKMMIIFSIAFITVLIFKVYMFKCVWRCYRFIKCLNSIEERSNSKMFQKEARPLWWQNDCQNP
uniref:Lysosomal protein transmembrane 5 n=1 Tax=Papio anubis TaxID=9555 RepID=A0A096N9A2_PAPAN